MLREDMANLVAEDLHRLQRVGELRHRLRASESMITPPPLREETRWPGHYDLGQ